MGNKGRERRGKEDGLFYSVAFGALEVTSSEPGAHHRNRRASVVDRPGEMASHRMHPVLNPHYTPVVSMPVDPAASHSSHIFLCVGFSEVQPFNLVWSATASRYFNQLSGFHGRLRDRYMSNSPLACVTSQSCSCVPGSASTIPRQHPTTQTPHYAP